MIYLLNNHNLFIPIYYGDVNVIIPQFKNKKIKI